MALFIASLNSGSNGNCYYIGTHNHAVLVDAGISLRETEKRMNRLGLSMASVRAIFVSHEHSDHITGIPGISKKYNLPVYITDQTFSAAGIPVAPGLLRAFAAGETVVLGDLEILAFCKHHDAAEPHSFIIAHAGTRVGVFTDIGNCCDDVIRHFNACQAVFLEANYCAEMLRNGSYPYVLKKRISGGKGHLSNTEALELFRQYRSTQLTHLILSHLSKNNNDPELVHRMFNEHAGSTQIIVASRYHETEVFCVEAGSSLPIGHGIDDILLKKRAALQHVVREPEAPARLSVRKQKELAAKAQLSLFQ